VVEELHISQLAEVTGVKPGMIRYFEKTGLITPSTRTASGYRLFGPHHVKELQFVRRMHALGFYAQHIKRLREIKRSDLTTAEKREAIEQAIREHSQYIEERIAFFTGLRTRFQEAAPALADEVLEDDC